MWRLRRRLQNLGRATNEASGTARSPRRCGVRSSSFALRVSTLVQRSILARASTSSSLTSACSPNPGTP
eukprot:2319-Pelagococcus_subviridis.AAC.1